MKKKGRGLSYDEKRQRMLKIFHSSRSVFNFDEVNKLSIKAGIPFPVVKDVLNSLKADSLVECEKIGAGVFYWSFPSKAVQTFETKIAASEDRIHYYTSQIESLKEGIEKGQTGREPTPYREQMVAKASKVKGQIATLEKDISDNARFDPDRIALLIKQNKESKQMINDETDNLEQIKKYIKRTQPGTKDSEIEENFGIDCDLDYIE